MVIVIVIVIVFRNSNRNSSSNSNSTTRCQVSRSNKRSRTCQRRHRSLDVCFLLASVARSCSTGSTAVDQMQPVCIELQCVVRRCLEGNLGGHKTRDTLPGGASMCVLGAAGSRCAQRTCAASECEGLWPLRCACLRMLGASGFL